MLEMTPEHLVDRPIIAQSIAENIPILSRDELFDDCENVQRFC